MRTGAAYLRGDLMASAVQAQNLPETRLITNTNGVVPMTRCPRVEVVETSRRRQTAVLELQHHGSVSASSFRSRLTTKPICGCRATCNTFVVKAAKARGLEVLNEPDRQAWGRKCPSASPISNRRFGARSRRRSEP